MKAVYSAEGYEVGDLVNHNDVLYVCREAQAPARTGFTDLWSTP